ncbi:MAG TPA: diaminopimelate epimerase [Candidatus Evtepia excrementipullorum]|nr:diaminopimelate epimerase [Candidatus Evtepia excrementipullorum]
MQFWKMNGAGNDFIILNNIQEGLPAEAFPVLARTLCTPHRSLGADGFMVVEPAQGEGDFRMRFYNSDGSVGEMCGNGARCICRYGYETGLAGPTQRVETTAGLVIGERISQRAYRVRLNDPTTLSLHEELEAEGAVWPCAYVELGNPGLPHAVVPYPGLAGADPQALFRLGRALRNHPRFPKGANVNFYEVTGPDQVLEKTYERGVEDFTLACGTGTGSVVTVLTLLGQVSGQGVQVTMAGGVLTVDVERQGDQVTGLYLTGPTNLVAKGEIFDEDLVLP